MKQQRPLIVGNWKLNPVTAAEAKALVVGIRKAARTYADQVETIVAPPFPFITEVVKLSPSGRIGVAAQDVFYETSGPHTGEVSAPMLASLGVTHVIVGHSERRAMGETDAVVNQKAQAVIKAKLTAIICIGENKRDAHGDFYSVVAKQLKEALKRVNNRHAKQLVIAYEPIWAIGTGENATPEDVEEMRLFITKELTKHIGRPAAARVRILYGGSVKPTNVESLCTTGVNGFLVGGASLRPDDFSTIIAAAAKSQ